MYQLKIYTLRSRAALEQYAAVHWPRHLTSMPPYGATVHGFWTEQRADAHRLHALLSFAEGVDPAAFLAAYIASPELAADLEGFDVDAIVSVEDVALEPGAGSPLS